MSKTSSSQSCVEIGRRIASGLRTEIEKYNIFVNTKEALRASSELPPYPTPPKGPTHGEVLLARALGVPEPESESWDDFVAANKAIGKLEEKLGLDKLWSAWGDAGACVKADMRLLRRTRALTHADLHAKIRALDLLFGNEDYTPEVAALARSIRRDADAMARQPTRALAA